LDGSSITAAITGTGIVALVVGGVVRPYVDRWVRQMHERLEARIDGYDIGGVAHLGQSFFSVEDVARYNDLEASFLKNVDYAKYAAIVAVRNVKGQDVEKFSLTIGLPSFCIPCPPELGGRPDSNLPLLEASVFRSHTDNRMRTLSAQIERRLSVTDEAPVAQVAFFGPKSGDFIFYWRVSANGMAHPPHDFGTQQVRLRPLHEISTLLEEQARSAERRARRLMG